MTYKYYQTEGGDETWKPIRIELVDSLDPLPMFMTILSLETPVGDDFTKEQYAAIKYKGPLYFDLDDAESPASTSVSVVQLINKLEELGVSPSELQIYASGGKGFHVLVSDESFMMKPPKAGLVLLPAIYKEMAFKLAVRSLDLRVYTARKGRMFRMPNVERPNGLYKVPMSWDELQKIAELSQDDKEEAEALYKKICSKPRVGLDYIPDPPQKASGLMALFDECRAKVARIKPKKAKDQVKLTTTPPSFNALLRGEGILPDVGFHNIAMQVAITAHELNWTLEQTLEAAKPLCQNHHSDGNRYNTERKRRNELERMFHYMEDNPCYGYEPSALASLMSHHAPDLHGVEVSAESFQEILTSSDDKLSEYDHAGVTLSDRSAYVMTENGPRQILGLGFENVTALMSANNNNVAVLEATVVKGTGEKATHVFELDMFQSASAFNRAVMNHGQAFTGSEQQARGMYLRLLEQARKNKGLVYTVAREGLDLISMAFHENEKLRDPFPVWADQEAVLGPAVMHEANVSMKMMGFPDPKGQYQSDLSQAPSLGDVLRDDAQKAQLKHFLENLLTCQSPETIGKILGWMVSCFYRMFFHAKYGKFPLLHINGAGGMGKTEMMKLFSCLHYYRQEPKMLTPTSTVFAINYAIAGSASIPLILDEFKPAEMNEATYNKLKLMLRDAYNCRAVERGGGTRENNDYRSVHAAQLSGPVCFVAEAVESEPALMERVILLTLVKPPAIYAAQFFRKFSIAVAHRHLLGVIGNFIAARIVQKGTLEEFDSEFTTVYKQVERDYMIDPDKIESYSASELRRRSNMKSRTAFNYAVAKFGLDKFGRMLSGIFPGEFEALMSKMDEALFDGLEDLQEQTLPEWLKVLNTFADMALLPAENPLKLVQGRDFDYGEYSGQDVIELYANSCYSKYRAYCRNMHVKPYFPNTASFIHSINQLPALVSRSHSIRLNTPGGSHLFSMDILREYGFIPPQGE